VVIVPIFKTEEEQKKISAKANEIASALRQLGYAVKFDDRDTHKPGFKFAEWELKGVPIRIAIGPRDLDNGTLEIARRDTKEKKTIKIDAVNETIPALLAEIQQNIYDRAKKFRDEKTTEVNSYEELKKVLDEKGGFVSAHWDGTVETEIAVKEQTKATIRCIPLDARQESGKCVYSGKPSQRRVLFARAY
jgi:prolyl-tRNA synthetase